jgi:hypothetical protein
MIGARRAVARHLGLKLGEAESSGRCGVVHFHALLRLDADGARATGRNDLIVSAMRTAIARTTVGHPTRPDEPIRWGLQADLTPIDTEDRPRLAWYVAKYATKSVDTGGALDQRASTTAIWPAIPSLTISAGWPRRPGPSVATRNWSR